eukprot:1656809-Prymnesium_polylepis.1
MVVKSIEVGVSVEAHRPCERTTHHLLSCASVSKSVRSWSEVIHIAFPWVRAGCLCGPTTLSDHSPMSAARCRCRNAETSST